MRWDGLGRRISKAVTTSGDWNAIYHYFYDGHSIVEERNSSDKPIKQHVWGARYVDEFIQTGINPSPADCTLCSTRYWALQDANYNVLGIVDSSGDLKERYEYTPYGQRTVYKSAGSADPMLMSPILESQRVQVSGVDLPYGICDFGHQGLLFDKEFGWYHNRTRPYGPVMARFPQRDRRRYADGANLYQCLRSSPVFRVDPFGLQTVEGCCGSDVTDWFIKDLEMERAEFKEMADFLLGEADQGGGAIAYTTMFLKKAAYNLSYKWMDFSKGFKGCGTGKCHDTVLLVGVCMRKNELGNIAFGYLANDVDVAVSSGHSAAEGAYNGVLPGYPPAGRSEAGNWRTDNLAAFGVGKALADSEKITPDTLKNAMSNFGEYQDISKGGTITPSSLTTVTDTGFDTNKGCLPCGKIRPPYPGSESSREARDRLESEYENRSSRWRGSGNDTFDGWLHDTHGVY